jgi:divalent metal cation (Fe/Co/Zn/Cd) transporter
MRSANSVRRLTAVTFFVFAAYLIFESVRDLITGVEPETSTIGIAVALVSIVGDADARLC